MLRNIIEKEYLDWLVDLVCADNYSDSSSFVKLLHFLHDVEFTCRLRGDMDRIYDGVNLRHRYALSSAYYDYHTIEDILTGPPCSVLEMMIALAIRCEETIMDDTRYGDRTKQWFWKMIVNLDLGHMTDELFDRYEAEDIITKFLNRKYEPDGRGGLFRIKNIDADLRKVNIWTQMMWYLDTMI